MAKHFILNRFRGFSYLLLVVSIYLTSWAETAAVSRITLSPLPYRINTSLSTSVKTTRLDIPPTVARVTRTVYITTATSIPVTDKTQTDDPPQTNLVTSWNIFWALLTLSLSCIVHPLGSACGFSPKYRQSIRTSPLISFADTIHLLGEVVAQYRSNRSHPPYAAVDAIAWVLEERLRHSAQVSDIGRLPDAVLYVAFLDLRVRAIVAVLCILQYTKLCGYHGIPILFSISTMLFASWVVMEALFFIGSLHLKREHRYPSPRASARGVRALPVPRRFGIRVMYLHVALAFTPIVVISIRACGRSPLLWEHLELCFLVPILLVDSLGKFAEVYNNIRPESVMLTILVDLPALFIIFYVIMDLTLVWWGLIVVLPLYVAYRCFYLGLRWVAPTVVVLLRRVGQRVWVQGVYGAVMRHLVNLARGTAVLFGIGVFIYCVKVYDPEGTAKEGWAENLP